MKNINKLIIAVVIAFIIPACGQLKGHVKYVSDGDTFRFISPSGENVTVRVADVDCPEQAQRFGLAAKEFVINEIRGKDVEIIVKEKDQYGRSVAFVKYDGKDLSEELIKNGFAWHYEYYSDLQYLKKLENEARNKKIGLWIDSHPLAPWEFRKKNRRPSQ
jgi:micrococcal nuclease